MTANQSYRVEAVRSGNGTTDGSGRVADMTLQARRLEQVEARAREAISLMLDVEEEEVGELDIRVVPPDSVAALLREMQDSEATATAANERAASLRRQAAQQLRDDGFPLRDIGRITGISHQRVSQILAPTRSAG